MPAGAKFDFNLIFARKDKLYPAVYTHFGAAAQKAYLTDLGGNLHLIYAEFSHLIAAGNQNFIGLRKKMFYVFLQFVNVNCFYHRFCTAATDCAFLAL